MSRDQTGAATVYVLTACAAVLFTCLAMMSLAAAVTARERAGDAADAAALAGATRAAQGGAAACAAARRVAAADSADLVHCAVAGPVVTVRVRIRAGGLAGWRTTVEVSARAGPAGHSAQSGQAGPAS